jgi:hypothetical protein
MCDEMKVLFFLYRSPSPAAVSTIAKFLLPEYGRNNDNVKFLRKRGLEYLAQHRTRFNNDLNYYAQEYIKTHR